MIARVKCCQCEGGKPTPGVWFCSVACAIQYVFELPTDDPAWKGVPMGAGLVSHDLSALLEPVVAGYAFANTGASP